MAQTQLKTKQPNRGRTVARADRSTPYILCRKTAGGHVRIFADRVNGAGVNDPHGCRVFLADSPTALFPVWTEDYIGDVWQWVSIFAVPVTLTERVTKQSLQREEAA